MTEINKMNSYGADRHDFDIGGAGDELLRALDWRDHSSGPEISDAILNEIERQISELMKTPAFRAGDSESAWLGVPLYLWAILVAVMVVTLL